MRNKLNDVKSCLLHRLNHRHIVREFTLFFVSFGSFIFENYIKEVHTLTHQVVCQRKTNVALIFKWVQLIGSQKNENIVHVQ